jgi:hypothetical protein
MIPILAFLLAVILFVLVAWLDRGQVGVNIVSKNAKSPRGPFASFRPPSEDDHSK